jgi:catechol 2,3-dioxygenase-like lactoylglutathione lyase family enzyme
MVTAIFTAIYVSDLERSKDFYCDFLGLKPVFESDWIIQIASADDETINLTLQLRNHELVPEGFRDSPQGISVAFVVPDTDEIYAKAIALGFRIVQEPKNEIYGQRRFLTVDPDGLLVDVSSECEPSAEFKAQYMGDDE